MVHSRLDFLPEATPEKSDKETPATTSSKKATKTKPKIDSRMITPGEQVPF